MKIAILAALLLVVGCSKPTQQNAPTESKPEHAQEAKSPDNLLHIEPEMMRDLRITTSAVERRRGGEGVSLLGEVTVNEDSYSQVGAPIAARVVRSALALASM
jgi:membrane fusion protein, heavy metal efflux system